MQMLFVVFTRANSAKNFFRTNEREVVFMTYKSDIEIAQATPMQPITEVAKTAGIDEKYLELYGR